MISLEKGKTPRGFEYQVETENGDWNGLYQEFYKDGSLKETGMYCQNIRVGKFKIFSNDDRHCLSEEHIYDIGSDPELILKYSYFTNGNIKSMRTISSNVDEEISYNESGGLEKRVDYKNYKSLTIKLRDSKFSDIRENIINFVNANYKLKTTTVLAIETVDNKGEIIKSFNLARLSQDLKKIISGKETGKEAHHKGYDLRAPNVSDNIEWLLKFSTESDIENDRNELNKLIKKNKNVKFLYIQRV